MSADRRYQATAAEPLRVHIEDRNPDGRGRARSGSTVVLVSQAHPGEEVEVRVDRRTRGTVQGRVARLLRQDPERIAHDCAHEHLCTGCPLLALEPGRELELKRASLRMLLADALPAGVSIEPVRRPAGPFAYRHYAKQVFAAGGAGLVLGSYVAGTHEVVDNDSCPVLTPGLRALLRSVVSAARRHRIAVHGPERVGLRYAVARESAATGEQLLVLVTSQPSLDDLVPLVDDVAAEVPALASAWASTNSSDGNALLAGTPRLLRGTPSIRERLAGYEHAIGPTSFFQINPAAAEVMVRVAVELAGEGDLCVEGYAGTGALTLPLSERFSSVVGVESNAAAVASLRAGAEQAGRSGAVEGIAGDAAALLPELVRARGARVVVVDPPRKGLGPELAGALASSPSIDRLVLVACGPDALARDLVPLVRGGLRVDRVVPVDQFPRTGHVETVARLVR